MRCTGSGSSCSSNSSSSIAVACCEKNAKLTPLSCTVAPSGCGRPDAVGYCAISGVRPGPFAAALRAARRVATVPSPAAAPRPAALPLRFSATSTPSAPRAAALTRWSGRRRNVCLVGITLADLDDVSVGILHPRRPPAGYEVVEAERAERHPCLAAHRRQRLIDVVDLEGNVPEAAAVVRAVFLGRSAGGVALGLEQLEIDGARFEEDDLIGAERDHPRAPEAEMRRVELLRRAHVLAVQRYVRERHRHRVTLQPAGRRRPPPGR